MDDPVTRFAREVEQGIAKLRADEEFRTQSRAWMRASVARRYSYHFRWLGRPVIQYPQDLIAMQELIVAVRPDLVIETGIAHGGSLVFYASILELLGHGRALGIDIEIRSHNRQALEAHPLRHRYELIEGSSIAPEVVAEVRRRAEGQRVLVVLDSNHTHAHVLAELRAYAPLVSVGSYCVVMDTIVEEMPAEAYPDRPWGPGNNPWTAVRDFLAEQPGFEVDADLDAKLQLTQCAGGWLKRIA
jgi:cephalosporin hydroxylase